MHDSPREVLAHGENWLEALREGRRQLGEDAGLPPGASCVMAPNGEVTLLDGGQRRRYVLTPLAAQAAPSAPTSSAQPNGKHAGAAQRSSAELNTAQESPPQHAAHVSPPSGSNGGPSSGLPKQAESAALAVSPTLPAPPLTPRAPASTGSAPVATASAPAAVVAPVATSAGRARQTVEFSPERAQALQREFETARARAIPTPEVASPTEPTEPPKLPHPNLRAVTANNVRASSLPPPSAPSSLPPPPAAALRSVAARTASGEQRKARPLGSSLYGVRDEGLSLLHARDLDPTDESPLTYRERAYLLGGKADRVRLEVLLQAELACIRRELSGFPRGQFVRLGLFAEPFEGAPNSPPIATLEWKDWRGRAQFQLAPDAKSEPQGVSSSASSEEVSSQGHVATSLPMPSLAAQRSASQLSQPALAPTDSLSGSEASSRAIPSTTIASTAIPSTALEDEFEQGEPDLRLASAFEAMSELYLLPTPVAGLEFTLQLLARLVPCEAMSCCLYDINTDEFRFVALSGLGALDRKASAIRANVGLFGAARRQVLVVPDVSQDARYRPAVDGRSAIETKSLAYAPLRYNNQLLGIVQLINRSSDAGFTSADVSVLSYVAEQLGEFLANCRALIG